jgi:hypothetical protein
MAMTKKDREALDLCIKIASRDPKFEEVCKGVPNSNGGWFVPPKTWEEKAQTACHWCQFKSLNLKPWQSAPYSPTVDPINGDDAAIRLRDKMLAAGVSIYHPDPMAALHEARQCVM